MAGLLDLYGDALTPDQRAALQQRGLLGFLGGMAKSGALDYTVPFISGKMPGSFASGIAAGAAGMGEAQDAGALNAMRAQQLGLNAQETRANLALLHQEAGVAANLYNGQGGAVPTTGPSPAGPGGAPAASPNAIASPNIDSVTAGDTPEWRAFAQAVAGPESSGKFNVRYSPRGPVPFDDFSKHPNIAEKGPAGPSTAAGAWQITNSTLNSLGDERPADFSPANQYTAFKTIARRDYSAITGRDLDADLKAGKTDLIARGLGGTWPTIDKAMQAYPSLLANYSQAGTKVADNAPGLNTSLAGAGDNTGAGFGGAPTAAGNGFATMLRSPASTAGGSLPPRPPGSAITYDGNGTPIDLDTGRPVGAPAASAGGPSAAQPTPVVSNGTPMPAGNVAPPPPGMLGSGLSGVMGAPTPPAAPGMAGIMGAPASSPPAPGMAGLMGPPGGINPQAAQALSLLQSMRKANTPAFINEAATMPFVGPKAAATAWGQAPAQLYVKNNEPYTLRPGGIRGGPDGPTYGAPTVQEFENPDGSKYRALVDPISGSIRPITTAGAQPAVSGIGPGQVRALQTRADKEQGDRQTVINEANAAQHSRATLMTMSSEAPNFYQGAGADKLQSLARYLRIIDPNWNGQVSSFEDFQKNAGSLTRQAVKEVSSRAAVQEFNLIGNSLPNPEMSPIGLRRVQNEMIGLTDYRLAKAQAQQGWEQQHGGPGNVTGFETYFQRAASPYAFIVAKMDPADRREMFAKLQSSADGQRELARLGQQLQFLKQSGLAQ